MQLPEKKQRPNLMDGLQNLPAQCSEDGDKTWHEQYPIIRRSDITRHRKKEDRIWVSHGDGVFDVTEFVDIHPGGSEKLMMVAGGAIEPFWEMYPFHKEDSILQMLNQFKIGILHPEDKLETSDLPDFTDI